MMKKDNNNSNNNNTNYDNDNNNESKNDITGKDNNNDDYRKITIIDHFISLHNQYRNRLSYAITVNQHHTPLYYVGGKKGPIFAEVVFVPLAGQK